MTEKNRPSPLGIRLDDGKESRVKYSTPDEHKKRGKYYFTVQDIADISSVSTSTIRHDIASGVLRHHVKRGTTRPLLVDRKELRRWLADEFPEVDL